MGEFLRKIAVEGARALGSAVVSVSAHMLKNSMQKRNADPESIEAVDKVKGAMDGIAPDISGELADKAVTKIEEKRAKKKAKKLAKKLLEENIDG